MKFSEQILPLSKYLLSIRMVIKDQLMVFVIDLKMPPKWDIMKFLSTPEEKASVTLQKNSGDDEKIYSFFTTYSPEAVDELYNRVVSVINKSLEEEKKRKLFGEKLQELKKSFDEQIQQLKDKFETTPLDELEKIVNHEEEKSIGS